MIAAPNRVGLTTEWTIQGLPVPARPFADADWRIQATLVRPGQPPAKVEGFWYVPFRDGKGPEDKVTFTPTGKAEWRLRFTPMRPGAHRMRVRVTYRGALRGTMASDFRVAPGPLRGFTRVNPRNSSYLVTADGQRMIPIGWNLAWWTQGGFKDYEKWSDQMQTAGMNFARLWMSPWCFGIETDPGQLGNYGLDRAWALDRVLETLRQRGIHVMLCLDYHGMLNETKDFWGGNDNWRLNPYNQVNGGPARTQNEFFTDPAARALYRQRLRYLVSRYGSYPNVAVWEFWNEIDNVQSTFQANDMIAWHREMAAAVRQMDPYGRLVSTSLTSDTFPSLWSTAKLDLVQSHSYNASNPGIEFAERAARFRLAERRPYLVGEYGVDFRAPMLENDPKQRGLKQALWGSLIGGGAGSAQSWWWETLHTQGVYPMYRSLSRFVSATPIGSPGWQPLRTTNPEASTVLPPARAGSPAFTVRIPLVNAWGDRNRGVLILTDALGAGAQSAHLNGYLHGTSKPELRRPFRLKGHFGPSARMGYRLNSVSQAADLRVLVDDREVAAKAYPDRDGKTEVIGEYNDEVSVAIPEGTHTVEIRNVGPDWAALDWVEVAGVRPTQALAAESFLLATAASGTDREAAIWVMDRAYSYPANARELSAREVKGGWTEVRGMRDGPYSARWWHTRLGMWQGTTTAMSSRGRLRLTIPPFTEDIAAMVRRQPK